MATKTDTTKLDEAYAEVKQLEKAQIEAAFPDDPWPASEAKKQIEDHEQRLAFLEARLGMTKPIREHEFDASEHVVPESPTAPRALYRDSGVVEGMQAQNVDDGDDRTLEDLQKEASDLDIKGRSSMNKDELAAAIADKRGDTVPA